MKKTKFKVPEWHGRHPFPPDKKKPTLISRDKILHFLLYGKTAYTDMNWLLASTDNIHVGIYLIPPGGRFDPPDIHAGEEVYFMLEGTLTIFNPQTGDVHEVLAGEGLWIPKDCWHQGHNFTDRVVKGIWGIAPLMWDLEKGPPTEYPGAPQLFRYEEPKMSLWKNTDLPRMKVLNGDNCCRVMFGKEHRIPVTFYVSTNMIHMGEFTIPHNGYSEPESHNGDEVVFALRESLTIFTPSTQETFEVKEGEAFFIPENVKHQYYNFTNGITRSVFVIAPKL